MVIGYGRKESFLQTSRSMREVLAMKGSPSRLGAYFDMRSQDELHRPLIGRLVRLAADLGKEFNTSLSVVSGGRATCFGACCLRVNPCPDESTSIGTAFSLGFQLDRAAAHSRLSP